MPATLDALAAKGYKFVTVTELIAMNKPKPSPTPVASTGQERPESVKSAKTKPVKGNSEAHIQPNGQEQNDRALKPEPASAGQ